jgi:ribonuclease E
VAGTPPTERPASAPAPEVIKELATAAEATGEVTAIDAAAATGAAETEGGQSRRRRGRRGGRRRRRHEDANQAGAQTTESADEQHFDDLDDEDRIESAAPATTAASAATATVTAAAVAAHVLAAAPGESVLPDVTHSATQEKVAPTQAAPIQAPEQVLSAVAPASFNLPALPPIPSHEVAVESAAEHVHVEAPVVAEVASGPHSREALAVADAVVHTSTTDVAASTSHTPDMAATTATEEPARAAEVATTIDFRAHLDVSPKIESATEDLAALAPVAVPPAESVEIVKTEIESTLPIPAQPAQGDLLDHAGLAQQPKAEPAPATPAKESDAAQDVKKDASSHG